MKNSILPRRSLVMWALLLTLPLALAGTPAACRELYQLGNAVIELPGKIVTGFHNFSLDRLDPTCPQCI